MVKVICITGASSGLGKELARQYLEKHYLLVLSGQDEEGLGEFKKAKVDICRGDLTKDVVLDSLVRLVISKYGRIDILINNAGITYIQPFEENTPEQFDKIIAIDLKVPMFLTQKLWPLMVKQKSGHIINIISTAGREGKINHTMYCAAKYGLRGFSDALRVEAKKYSIRVTSVFPGGIKTELYRHLKNPPDTSAFMDPKQVAQSIVQLSESTGVCPDELVLTRM